jgi:hypothetical protein
MKCNTETIALSGVDYLEKFRKYFRTEIQKPFVYGKTTVGNDVYLEIKSTRVNEFVMMLDDFSIRWRHIKESYK